MQRKAGFTLIEMLVVIALIFFLATLTFLGIHSVRKSIRRDTTKSLVGRIDSAIRAFHAQYLEWPPTPEEMPNAIAQWGLPEGTTWYEFMNGVYAKAIERGEPKFEYRGPFLVIEDRFIDKDTGDIMDVWGNPIAIEIDAAKKSVLVYSFGEDEESDMGHYLGDGCPDADHAGLEEPVDDISTRGM